MPGPASGYKSDEHPEAVRKLAARWKPKTEIAEALGIDRATLDRWIDKHPELAAAYAIGRDEASDHVERALFERATGYSHPSEKIVVVSGGQGMGSSVERVDITEHYPPDPAALKMWLNNRRPTDWADKQQVSVDMRQVPPSEMTTEELERQLALLAAEKAKAPPP